MSVKVQNTILNITIHKAVQQLKYNCSVRRHNYLKYFDICTNDCHNTYGTATMLHDDVDKKELLRLNVTFTTATDGYLYVASFSVHL